MTYNVRDLLGHYVVRSGQGKMCPHACCRGRRVHPKNYPVVLPNKLLRQAPDEDLAYHYQRTDNEAARDQVLYEMDRRDQAAKRERDRAEVKRQRAEDRAAAKEARAAARAASSAERDAVVQHEYDQAEAATNGYMVNRLGQSRGVSERSLFHGPESRARKYASPELLEYWQTHHRPTAAMFAGQDTRVHEIYTNSGRVTVGVRRRRRATA